MAEAKFILVLANSARAKKHCVAGKVATPLGGGKFTVTDEWIRLADPRDEEGAVPYANTICPGRGMVRPLQIIQVVVQGPCGNPDHPEDWYFEPSIPWELVATAGFPALHSIADHPETVWHDSAESHTVPAGYLRSMGAHAASLYLLKAPAEWTFTFWRRWNPSENRDEIKRRLAFTYAGQAHEFSVTDTDFTSRHNIYDRATEERQSLESPNPNAYFCLSLTKLRPQFNRKHYKVCATVFEP